MRNLKISESTLILFVENLSSTVVRFREEHLQKKVQHDWRIFLLWDISRNFLENSIMQSQKSTWTLLKICV